MFKGCLVCVICNSNSIHSFIFKLCIMVVHHERCVPSILCTFNFFLLNDSSHIINVHLLYYAHFTIFFHFAGFELELKKVRWCVMCKLNSSHFLIFKLCVISVHTLNMCTSFLWTFDKYFLILGLLNIDILFQPKCSVGVWFVLSVTQAVFFPLYSYFVL